MIKPVHLNRYGELDRIICPKVMRIGQSYGSVQQRRRNFNDSISSIEMRSKATKYRRCPSRGKGFAFAAACNRSGDLHGGNMGQINLIGRNSMGKTAHPGKCRSLERIV